MSKYRFNFEEKNSLFIFDRLRLKAACRKACIDSQVDIINLFYYIETEFNMKCSISFADGKTHFYLKRKP